MAEAILSVTCLLRTRQYVEGYPLRTEMHYNIARVDNKKVLSLFFSILGKVGSVRHKTQVPYRDFHGANFQIDSCEYGVNFFYDVNLNPGK